jgi:hypothetical protein
MNNKNVISNKLDLNQAIRVSYTCTNYSKGIFLRISTTLVISSKELYGSSVSQVTNTQHLKVDF